VSVGEPIRIDTNPAPPGWKWVYGQQGYETAKRPNRGGDPAAEVISKADALLADRAKDYADPVANHERIAGMWRSLFGWDVRPRDVAMAMVCVKLSREYNAHKGDNLDDIDGYVEIIRRIEAV